MSILFLAKQRFNKQLKRIILTRHLLFPVAYPQKKPRPDELRGILPYSNVALIYLRFFCNITRFYPSFSKESYPACKMIRNFIKSDIHDTKRQKVTTMMNILSLSTGIAKSIPFFLFICV